MRVGVDLRYLVFLLRYTQPEVNCGLSFGMKSTMKIRVWFR